MTGSGGLSTIAGYVSPALAAGRHGLGHSAIGRRAARLRAARLRAARLRAVMLWALMLRTARMLWVARL